MVWYFNHRDGARRYLYSAVLLCALAKSPDVKMAGIVAVFGKEGGGMLLVALAEAAVGT